MNEPLKPGDLLPQPDGTVLRVEYVAVGIYHCIDGKGDVPGITFVRVSRDDQEMVRLCAEAMGYSRISTHHGGLPLFTFETAVYNPLADDAQAMALVKKFGLSVTPHAIGWQAYYLHSKGMVQEDDPDLNRAICLCVAQMWQAKA